MGNEKKDDVVSINFNDLIQNIKSSKEKSSNVEDSEIETLDLFEEDNNYYSFSGLKKINQTNISDSIDKIREVIKEIENSGFKVKNDELDLENKHRFIIEIEKN